MDTVCLTNELNRGLPVANASRQLWIFNTAYTAHTTTTTNNNNNNNERKKERVLVMLYGTVSLAESMEEPVQERALNARIKRQSDKHDTTPTPHNRTRTRKTKNVTASGSTSPH
jgi:hypothetical protein